MRFRSSFGAMASAIVATTMMGLASTAVAEDEDFVSIDILADGPLGTSLRFTFAEPLVNQIRIDGNPWDIVRLGNESIHRRIR